VQRRHDRAERDEQRDVRALALLIDGVRSGGRVRPNRIAKSSGRFFRAPARLTEQRPDRTARQLAHDRHLRREKGGLDMYRMLSVVSAGALVLALQLPIRAAGDDNAVEGAAKTTGNAIKNGAEATGHAIKSGAEATGHAIKSGAQATGEALGISKSDREKYESMERGEHRVSGKVSAVDRDNGTLSLATDATTLNLYFPPKALKNVSVGDRLTAVLAFATPDKNPPSGTTKPMHREAGDEPRHGDHWITGTVRAVDPANGIVDVDTDQAPLKVQFAPAAVRDLQTGDRIAVESAFLHAPGTHQHHKTQQYQ
jgi:hypothetical protein